MGSTFADVKDVRSVTLRTAAHDKEAANHASRELLVQIGRNMCGGLRSSGEEEEAAAHTTLVVEKAQPVSRVPLK